MGGEAWANLVSVDTRGERGTVGTGQVTGTQIGGCTQQVVCNATWNQTQARGIVAIYVVDPVSMIVDLCSGKRCSAAFSSTSF